MPTINLCLWTAAGSYNYADDLCITTQQSDFQHVEQTLELALDEISIYYSSNHLKPPNPANIQICCFNLRNRDAKRKLDVTWNALELNHYPNPIYLGVTLDRTLSFKQHALNTKAKVNTRNNLLRKLTNSRWELIQVPYEQPHWRFVFRHLNMPVLRGAVPDILGMLTSL